VGVRSDARSIGREAMLLELSVEKLSSDDDDDDDEVYSARRR
jgi:hypothetical protein